MLNKVWGEIIYPFPNFNGATVEVWEWISNFIPHFIMDVCYSSTLKLTGHYLPRWRIPTTCAISALTNHTKNTFSKHYQADIGSHYLFISFGEALVVVHHVIRCDPGKEDGVAPRIMDNFVHVVGFHSCNETNKVIYCKYFVFWNRSKSMKQDLSTSVSLPLCFYMYRRISNIKRTKSQSLNNPRLVLHLSLPHPLKPGIKSRMKM